MNELLGGGLVVDGWDESARTRGKCRVEARPRAKMKQLQMKRRVKQEGKNRKSDVVDGNGRWKTMADTMYDGDRQYNCLGELTLYSSIVVVVCMRGDLYGRKSM